jgi:hypothetical protein
MGTARYAFSVRGPARDAVMTALPEGSQAEADPAGTAVFCWLVVTHRSQTPATAPQPHRAAFRSAWTSPDVG